MSKHALSGLSKTLSQEENKKYNDRSQIDNFEKASNQSNDEQMKLEEKDKIDIIEYLKNFNQGLRE